MHMTFFRIHDQFGFVGRNDDGLESLPDPGGGATFIAPINTNFSVLVDVNFRLRIEMTMGASGSFTRAVEMRSNLNGGGYNIVSAVSPIVKTSPTIFYGNQSDATEGIIGPTRTGYERWADDTNNHRVDNNIETGNCNYSFGNQYMSAEFCMQIIGDDVNDGDTIQMRLRRANGTNLSNYFITPVITVLKPFSIGDGGFASQLKIFIPGARQIQTAGQVPQLKTFIPGARQIETAGQVQQLKTFIPGARQIQPFSPGSVQLKTFRPGPTQARTAGQVTQLKKFSPGATQIKTFSPGASQLKTFVPGAKKGTTR